MSGETVTGQVAGSEDGRARMTAGRAGGLLAIGGTPVVRLAHLADDRCAEVWVKMARVFCGYCMYLQSVASPSRIAVRERSARSCPAGLADAVE